MLRVLLILTQSVGTSLDFQSSVDNIQSEMVSLSIIIVNYNTSAYLRKYLNSLNGLNLKNISIDICVIDNGSRDDSARMVKEFFPDVRLISNRENIGYAKAANHGIRSSNGKYIIISNADIHILDNALEELVIYLENHQEVGVIGPKVYDDPERKSVQCSCRSFPSFKTALFNRYSLLTRLFPGNRWSNQYLMLNWCHNKPTEVDWVSGCFFIVRREAISGIGFFDERFFMYNEDVDLCYRIKKAGWKVLYLPYAEIAHKIGASRLNRKAIRERHKGMWLFYSKHYANNRLLDIPIMMGILIRMAYSLLYY